MLIFKKKPPQRFIKSMMFSTSEHLTDKHEGRWLLWGINFLKNLFFLNSLFYYKLFMVFQSK